MPLDQQIADNLEVRDFKYKRRDPYLAQPKHLSDQYKNLGYDYRGRLLRKSTSPELWANPILAPIYSQYESLIGFILEQVKYIKKTFSFAHNKEDINVN
jgi:hypothetical protein